MFNESFIKLEIDEIASIIDVVNKKIDGSIFDPLETTILAIDVPFYPGYRFLNISDHATSPPLQRFVFQKNGTYEFVVIDWTYKTVYLLNKVVPISLNDDNILEYISFFFSYVKGRHGKFIICESVDSIRWKDEPSGNTIKKITNVLQPLKIEEKREDGIYKVKAFVMLKNSLFGVDIFVNPDGEVKMLNHKIVMENLSVVE